VVHVPAQKSGRHFRYAAFSFHQLEVPPIICEIIYAFQVSSTTSLLFLRFSQNALVKMLSRYLYFCSTLSNMTMSFGKRNWKIDRSAKHDFMFGCPFQTIG
jgi:hypothetical protein